MTGRAGACGYFLVVVVFVAVAFFFGATLLPAGIGSSFRAWILTLV
jgi:hypothetical protein